MKNLNKEIILETIKKNKLELEKFGVKKLILFGSYARDKQKSDSDIDFLVEFRKDRGNYKDVLNTLHFLEDKFDKKIDLGQKKSLRKEFISDITQGVQYEARI
jgi:hypothetical protein